MRTVMLHDRKYSPLRHWTDATWFYIWSSAHQSYLLMPYIQVAHDDIRVQRPTNLAWLKLPAVLEQMAEQADEGRVKHIMLAEAFTRELMESGVIE